MLDVYKMVVKAGAKFLDTHFGNPNWRLKCEEIDISDPDNCILTRLFGSYSGGLKALGMETGIYHGFDIGRRAGTYHYENLQKAWEDEFANPPLGTDDE